MYYVCIFNLGEHCFPFISEFTTASQTVSKVVVVNDNTHIDENDNFMSIGDQTNSLLETELSDTTNFENTHSSEEQISESNVEQNVIIMNGKTYENEYTDPSIDNLVYGKYLIHIPD